ACRPAGGRVAPPSVPRTTNRGTEGPGAPKRKTVGDSPGGGALLLTQPPSWPGGSNMLRRRRTNYEVLDRLLAGVRWSGRSGVPWCEAAEGRRSGPLRPPVG